MRNMKKINALSKRPKITVSEYVNRNVRKKLQDKSVLNRYKGKMYFLKEAEYGTGIANWENTRGYMSYNTDFKILTQKRDSKKNWGGPGESIFDHLAKIQRK